MKNICSKSLSSKYETMLIKLKHGFVAKLVIITSSLLLMSSFILGTIMMNNSQTAIKSLIDSRMLDVANTAADMIDGDVLEKLTERDIGTEPYKKIYDTLAVFQKNIGLRYIYTVRDLGNKQFVFIIDPSEDPGEFGESIVYTDALYSASKGTPCVDKKPYVDRWGRFYSAFSPVFDSQKNIAGIVAVDFSADWIDKQVNKQTNIIILNTVLTVLFGILLILITQLSHFDFRLKPF